MTTTIEIIVLICIGLGVFLTLVAAFGIIRLPDVYTRNHAASKSSTLGVMLILVGTFIYFYASGNSNTRLILAIVFIFITSPVGGHLINRAAYYTGVKMWEKSARDDLKGKIHTKDMSNH
ncbi:monovalent cation/H(+) antiporter subunit G [Caldibacillus thermolactis]|uniref:Monovalent cation/H(+) antiporter subunit G n=1 Tax=Pallidibacillus thermolactis TaxID=251051 RepID=A0ABT2WIS4_9BACI|nr:monovalent cation/H(+) antiporter subunit G [Pallidibacillus thermolactis]MCU9595583.1 monovalent cation/H(+) antiporter subunit G [Pallidibacillus thermolactis]MCU9600945.1 monovalent cation/H(+) antiporter subunit G [Pallidibacillus thermolactis subsp. kokeshiiformis]MED1674391.1 monovalent cation/H(+) antiporter subunit G [Pallidibacillus thermolactis subsp. kokeshiiformis]